jgi:DNA-binding PadR family transcriptional regulator
VSLDHAILGLLSERPRSGYDLKTRCFDDALKPFWTADQAQIYRTLERLKAAKHVSVTTRRCAGRPDRRIYEITRSGREQLDAWLAQAHPSPTLRDPFLLQLYFGASVPDDDLLGVLESRRAEHERRLEELRLAASELAAGKLGPRTEVLRQTALDGAAERERALISWLDDCIHAVTEGALPGSEGRGIGQRHLFGAEPA